MAAKKRPANRGEAGGWLRRRRPDHPILRAIELTALSYRPFRKMRIERASADICCIGQFRFHEFLGFELIRKSFGRSVMSPLSGQLSRFKGDVPGVFGPVSHGTLVQIAPPPFRDKDGNRCSAMHLSAI
jgi:hypothetical protein